MAGISGRWAAANAAVNPMYSEWNTVDPRHGQAEGADPRQVANFSAPPYQPTGPGAIDALTPVGDRTELPDQTPITHAGTPRNPGMTLAELGAAHTSTAGAVSRTVAHERLRKAGDAYVVHATRDMGPTPTVSQGSGRHALIRGLNAYPENNPPREMYGGEGWRRGEWLISRTDHRLALPTRRHRFRVTRRMVAQSDVSSPPPESGGGPYNAAWPSLQRSIRRNYARPRLRRTPGRFAETAVTDGTEQAGYGPQVGAFV